VRFADGAIFHDGETAIFSAGLFFTDFSATPFDDFGAQKRINETLRDRMWLRAQLYAVARTTIFGCRSNQYLRI